jgi:hypothetical protein
LCAVTLAGLGLRTYAKLLGGEGVSLAMPPDFGGVLFLCGLFFIPSPR